MSDDSIEYTCPGRAMAEPEGYVACYRAGHACPPKVALVEVNDFSRVTRYKCPCCGDGGVSFSIPHEWDITPTEDARLHNAAEVLANG
jgi:hypothetical protein